jgi:hypothetical protein
MRVPVPKNRLVAFTLVGALLTAGVAGILALPGGGLAQAGEQTDSPGSTASDTAQQTAVDTPTPNQDFTPAVQTQSGHEDEEHEEHEENDEHEAEGYEEERDDEYEAEE